MRAFLETVGLMVLGLLAMILLGIWSQGVMAPKPTPERKPPFCRLCGGRHGDGWTPGRGRRLRGMYP